VEARRRVRMLGAEHIFLYRQSALVEQLGTCKFALGLEQGSEVVEARRRLGMLGPSTFSRVASASRHSGAAWE
jgi:hypothetical protein